MPKALKAIYHNGAFIRQTPDELPEGTEVEILIKSSQPLPPPTFRSSRITTFSQIVG
jgi:predicted DNA-binding antitoxin AbrB/MazE fold protein